MAEDTFSYEGYDIPIELMNLTGGGPDSFGAISEGHIAHLRKHVGLWTNQYIVEIGCGIGRDAIPLTRILDRTGCFIGIDITRASIEWCNANISPKHPNFSFYHYDVADPIYNLSGKLSISDCKIPAKDQSIDLIIAQSVFTHMLEQGIQYYLSEFARLLKPRGKIYTTCFVVDESMRSALCNKPATAFGLEFRHSYSQGCFINTPENPTAAVAYTLPKLQSMVASAGLVFQRPLLRGNWSGTYRDTDCGQDTMILGCA